MRDQQDFSPLLSFLKKVPSIEGHIGAGQEGDAWWAKFTIETSDSLAWRVVQEMGHVLNYLSLEQRLPTVFMPVSPPPYLNGGVAFLSWVIECRDPTFTPADIAEWLEGRLPQPVEDRKAWEIDDDAE